jgi:hypothetical protein
MKINFAENLLIIATLVFLSSCEVEDTSGYNCIPEWTLELGIGQANLSYYNFKTTSFGSGIHFHF